jgi:hypothetical protein
MDSEGDNPAKLDHFWLSTIYGTGSRLDRRSAGSFQKLTERRSDLRQVLARRRHLFIVDEPYHSIMLDLLCLPFVIGR